MQEFIVGDLKVHVFPAKNQGQPVVYLHGLEGFALNVQPLLDQETNDYSLVVITLPYEAWSNLLAPWNTPEGWPQYVACTGGAPTYLPVLLNKIIPKAEGYLQQPSQRIIAGYSLGGLFALWIFFECDLFAKAACPSGSFWFPGFDQWFFEHKLKRIPQAVYFSGSEEEFNSSNKYLSPVKPTVNHIKDWLSKQGCKTTFVLDPGNHYEDVLNRTAQGILWCLEN